jgi:GT2 family glycosyltransferase
MASNPSVYALVVNWNRAQDTIECLDSLKRQEPDSPTILVLDNGSQDNSVEIIKTRFPDELLIECPNNLGFGGGANLGFKRALESGADYIFLINNDAIAAPDTLRHLMRFASQDIGLLAPLVYYHNEPTRIWSAGGRFRHLILEITGDMRDQPDSKELPDVLEKDFVTACCLLIPRDTIETVGGFDNQTFQHFYEDFDFCLRVRHAGKKIFVIPQAKVWHKVAVSTGGKDSPEERYWMARSSVAFFRKHATLVQAPFIFLWRLGSAIKTILRLSISRRWDSITAYLNGLRDGLSLKL